MIPSSLLCLVMWLLNPWLQAQTLTPKLWNGEALARDEGVLYIQGSIINADAQPKGGAFTALLQGQTTKLMYQLYFEALDIGMHPDRVWKLKADRYLILDLKHIDKQGKSWQWRGPYRAPVLVKAQALANGGIWYLVQLKQAGKLSFLIKSAKNVFRVEKTQGSLTEVFDALSGAQQLSFRQRSAERAGEIRAVMRSTRTISLFYKIDLFRQNHYAQDVMEVIQTHDADLRTCYSELLDRRAGERGELSFQIILSHNTHSIKTIKIKKADIREERFLECLYYKLMALSFPVSESVLGELTFTFQSSGA